MKKKTLKNTDSSMTKINVADVKTWGDGDLFKLISKAYSQNEDWMKSTKAMEIPDVGCVVQVTTQQGNNIAEAVTFVPGTMIAEITDDEGNVIARRLLPIVSPAKKAPVKRRAPAKNK